MPRNNDIENDPFASAQAGASSQSSEFDTSGFGGDTLFGSEQTDTEESKTESPSDLMELSKITPHIHDEAQRLVSKLDDSRGNIVAREINSINHPGEYAAAHQEEWSVVGRNIMRINSGDKENIKKAIMHIHGRIGSIRQAVGRVKQSSGETFNIYERGMDSLTDKTMWNATVASILADNIERLAPDVFDLLHRATGEGYAIRAIENIYTESRYGDKHSKKKFERNIDEILYP